MLRKRVDTKNQLEHKIDACTSFLELKSVLGSLSPLEAHQLCIKQGSDLADHIIPQELGRAGQEQVVWCAKHETFFTDKCGLRNKVKELIEALYRELELLPVAPTQSFLKPAAQPTATAMKWKPQRRPYQKRAQTRKGKKAYPKKAIKEARTIDDLIRYTNTLSFIHDTRLQNGHFTSRDLGRLIRSGAIKQIPATFGLRKKVSKLRRVTRSKGKPSNGKELHLFNHRKRQANAEWQFRKKRTTSYRATMEPSNQSHSSDTRSRKKHKKRHSQHAER